MSHLISLDINSFDSFIAAHDVVVVDWFADWCKPCQQMLKILPQLAEEVAGVADIVKINVDEHPVLKDKYEIHAVPTFLFFKGGEEKWRFKGIMRLAEIKAKIESLHQLKG
jgi:thioredoxin